MASGVSINLGPGLTASPISRRIQEVGGEMLASTKLHEVEPGIFSTCGEPLAELGHRLIHARDTRVPLVEVKMLPLTDSYEVLQELFGITGKLVLSILGSDGVERSDRNWSKVLNFNRVGLSIPGIHIISTAGNYDPAITSILDLGHYYGYDGSRRNDRWAQMGTNGPSYGVSTLHDRYDGQYGVQMMNDALDGMQANFAIATAAELPRPALG